MRTGAAIALDAQGEWEAAGCVLCGATSADAVVTLAQREAPGGAVAVVRCLGCGLGRLQPRPSAGVVGRYYGADHNAFAGRRRGVVAQWVWDLVRDVAAASPGRGERLSPLRPLLRPLAEWMFDVVVPLDGRPGLRVLEVGCGYGDLLAHLASRGCAVTGLDADPRAVAGARGLGLAVHTGTLDDVPLPAASYDVAVLCHSLEHLPDPLDALRTLARLVRPGGRLHVAVPNVAAAALRVEGADWEHLAPPVHLWFFDAASLAAMVETAGFRIVRGPHARTAHRHALRWLHELGTLGPGLASRRWARCLAETARTAGSGDVLRLVAERP